ncbi:response regulator transcription factor [Streptococcus sp. zg-JUN1979]|uniref:response regulator transcription factor n=1 Tax=Streptococcus sp. zg-JUN1979 TaxID=3391450 RepID=UPI0039A6ACF3
MRILLAEDEEQLARVIHAALTHEGYDVDVASDGQMAVEFASQKAYDMMIMDVMMPKKTGIEALKEIRQSGSTAQIMLLTAMSEIDDRVTGLDAGADDYLTKPFSLKELLARLRSMNRRMDSLTPNSLQFANTSLNLSEQELKAHTSIRLSAKETKLLSFLMLNAQKELPTEQLYEHVWYHEEDADDQGYVFMYISYLRQKLKAIGSTMTIIGTEETGFCLDEVAV